MKSLLLKELRSLRPFIGLVLFFIALNAGYILVDEYPDQFPLSKLAGRDEGDLIMECVLAFALTAGLLVREHDEGTLAFLDALPVSRGRIFCAKVIAGLGVLWLLPLSDLLWKAAVHAWSRTSLETDFQWQILLTRTGLDAAFCFICFSLGLALSFLRRFSFLVAGLAVCAYLMLVEQRAPWISKFNMFQLSEPVFQGRRWLLPTALLTAQVSLAVAALGAAYAGFASLGDASRRLAEKARRGRVMTLLYGGGTILLVLVWAGLAVFWTRSPDRDDPSEPKYSAWALGRAKTARYQFTYRQNQTGLAGRLADRADATEARVREFLGAKQIPRIEVDLTGSAPQTAGQAHWNKIQIDLRSAHGDVDRLVSVLGHETTHVYIEHESNSRIADDFNSTRFFHEGLATYVEYHLFLPAERLGQLRRVAAAMRARNQVKFDDLLNDQELVRKLDGDLVYPLGEVFVSALVKRYGNEAPGRVVRAFGRTNAPKDLHGLTLWQDTLQSCGYNLSDVEDLFYAELDQAVSNYPAFVKSLPRLRGAVEQRQGKITIHASFNGPAPGFLLCRFRDNPEAPKWLYDERFAIKDNVVSVDGGRYTDRSFWYQLGWQVVGASQSIYEPWVEVRREP